MRKRGHSKETIDRLIFENPAKFLSQTPKFVLPDDGSTTRIDAAQKVPGPRRAPLRTAASPS
jgi:hypothetical protein